ncbi:MAG: c-type cytochrome [Rhizobiales bacterium]|nr:c-type cytochrome [Hyphomicrobiales bacterium]
MRRKLSFAALLAAFAALSISATVAQLQGHGGPIKSIAVSPDGRFAISGSFDTSAIRWSLSKNSAEQVLRFHESAVNAVVVIPGGKLATGGEDGQVAIWDEGKPAPTTVLKGHTAPVVALAASPDGKWIASASWDRTIRLAPVAGGETKVLQGHQDNVNAVAFTPDGAALVSAGYDLTVRIWPLAKLESPVTAQVPSPLNAIAIARDGEIIVAGADGKVYFLSSSGDMKGSVQAAERPIISVAASPDGRFVAASAIAGSVAIIERQDRKVGRTLVGPGLPVWAVVFLPDSVTLVSGGNDRLVRRWDATSGEHLGEVAMRGPDNILAAFEGDRGAEVYKACVACHTLSPDEGNRAGPTLHGIFGRRIATLPGYQFSDALKKMNIVWTPETVAKLFEIGPMAYTPGTKMPEQKIASPDDRKALMEFLLKTTTKK